MGSLGFCPSWLLHKGLSSLTSFTQTGDSDRGFVRCSFSMSDSVQPDELEEYRAKSPTSAAKGPLWFAEVALLLLGGWAYWPTLRKILEAWNSNPDYSHGFLVVPIALGFLWAGRDRRPTNKQAVCWSGLILLAIAGGLRYVAGRFYLPEIDGWSIPLWLGGMVLLFHGWSFFRWALPSLAFLWFATPLPRSLETLLSLPLQHLAAQWGSWSLRLAGQPALAEGTTILLHEHVLDIERACSGLRMFYGIFALAVACVVLARLRSWSALVVLSAAVPVALVANVCRIAATGLLLQFFSGEAAGKLAHDIAGFVMIPLAVVMFGLLLLWLERASLRLRANRAEGMSWLLQWCVGALVVAGGLFGWGNYQSRHSHGALLELASQYESQADWRQVAVTLHRYLQANPADQEVQERFAEAFAKIAVSQRDKQRSASLCYKAWQKNRHREDLALSSVRMALEAGEYRRALQVSEELLSTTSTEENRQECTLLRAETLLRSTEGEASHNAPSWDQLAEALEATREIPTKKIRYEVELAKLWQEKLLKPDQKTRTQYARNILDGLVAKHTEDPLARLARHQFLVEHGLLKVLADQELAEQDLRVAVKLAESANAADQSTIFLAAASYAERVEELSEAEQFLRRAMVSTPSDPRPYIALAELKRTSDDPAARQEAMELLEVGLEAIGSKDSRLLLPLASLQVEAADWNVAKQSLDAAEATFSRYSGRRLSQRKLGAGLVRTQILWHTEGVYPAIRRLESIVHDEQVRVHRQLSPQLFAQAHVLLGKMYRSVEMSDRASEQYRLALQLDPAATATRTDAVASAMRAGDLESAEYHCRQILKENPTSRAALLAMIRIHVRRQLRQPLALRDWGNARRAFEKARAGDVPAASLLWAEVELRRAQGDFEAAERLLLQAVEQATNDSRLWRELALLLEQSGQMERALEAAEKSLEFSPEEIEPHILMATMLEKDNRGEEAQKLLHNLLGRSQGSDWVRAAQELARLQLLLGEVDSAKTLLEEVHRKEPANLSVISTLANLAWVSADWEAHRQCETWLHELEGEAGSLWRFHRAQRLLEEATASNDPNYEEVGHLSQTLQDLRPRWSKTSLLFGDIALRSGQIEAAIAAFQRAWNLGDRSALLADRLIELLTSKGRLSEARSYVSQIRSALPLSSRLFDRAIPYFVRDGEQARALSLAEAWVARQPREAAAYMRLGRILLLIGSEKTENYVQRAGEAFQQALRLAPSDVDVWVANVLWGVQEQESEAGVDPIIAALIQQVELEEFPRVFVLAQLNEVLGRPLQAQGYYRLALQLAEDAGQQSKKVEVLGRSAQFYLEHVPLLAEAFARKALAIDAGAALPQQILLQVLVERDQPEAIQETLALLEATPKAGWTGRIDFQRRMKARLLYQQAKPVTNLQAIELLETLLQKIPEDQRLLASLYERQGRLGPAFELLSGLAISNSAQPRDLVDFLDFWQRHFLTKTGQEGRPQFYSQAKRVTRQLLLLPQQQAEWLRWKSRETKALLGGGQLAWQEVQPLLRELLEMNHDLEAWSAEAKHVWYRSLIEVLLQEDLPLCAWQLVTNPPAAIAEVEAAIALCHAMILSPVEVEVQQSANELLQTLQARHSQHANLARSIGDYQFMSGQYALATSAYRVALALDPTNRMANNNLALSLAEQPGKLEEARSVLGIALEENEADPVLLDTLAVIDLIDQRADAALESLGRVLSATPENVAARIHVAMGYRALGEQNLMWASLIEAMRLGVNPLLLSPRDRAFFQETCRHGSLEQLYKGFRTESLAETQEENDVAIWSPHENP